MTESRDIRTRILEAAETRFRRLGFGKTTMAEIAGDVGMSAGNLYRYFENKEEIGAVIAARCLTSVEEAGRKIVRRPDLAASERLALFFLTAMRVLHDYAFNQATIHELVAFVSDKRWDIIERHMQAIHALIADILAQGNASGEFDIADVPATAWTVKAACKGFLYPPLVASCTLEELETQVRQVCALLVRGLARR